MLNIQYIPNFNKTENENIDLVQVEKEEQILLPKEEYENKGSSQIYNGIWGMFANIIGVMFNRKKYLKNIRNTK